MKSTSLLRLYSLVSLFCLLIGGHIEATAQETEKKGVQSLTFSRYPYQFNGSNNPLMADSPFLLQFSAPVLAVLLLSGLILGILARVFPQLNVFLLSFPVNIGISFVVIALTLDIGASVIRQEFDTLPDRFLTILSFLNF